MDQNEYLLMRMSKASPVGRMAAEVIEPLTRGHENARHRLFPGHRHDRTNP